MVEEMLTPLILWFYYSYILATWCYFKSWKYQRYTASYFRYIWDKWRKKLIVWGLWGRKELFLWFKYFYIFQGHTNNIHCLAQAVNQLLGCLFSLGGHDDTEDRLKEFLALASSSLLRLGQESSPQETKNRESVYILLHQIVQVKEISLYSAPPNSSGKGNQSIFCSIK